MQRSKRRRARKPLGVVGLDEARRFYEALSTLARAYQFRDRESTCYGDLSVTECYALETIDRESPLLVGGLAARMHLDKSNASRVARALARKGLVARTRSAEDTRAVELRVTARGRRAHAQVRSGIERDYRRLLAEYPPAVRRGATEILARLTPGGVTGRKREDRC